MDIRRRVMSIQEIYAVLEKRRVNPVAFWGHAMGGDRAPLPREDVFRVLREMNVENRGVDRSLDRIRNRSSRTASERTARLGAGKSVPQWSEMYGGAENARRAGVVGRLAEVSDGTYSYVQSTTERSAHAMLKRFASTASYSGKVTLYGRIVAADGSDADTARLTVSYPEEGP